MVMIKEFFIKPRNDTPFNKGEVPLIIEMKLVKLNQLSGKIRCSIPRLTTSFISA
ncbi:unnamed protein product [marine sediment metagenome]|uniref:Uncharacterized protein n=1 Tax=marine sediment metagenome TaxID=412755 RepID=X1REY2_9ZZZZ